MHIRIFSRYTCFTTLAFSALTCCGLSAADEAPAVPPEQPKPDLSATLFHAHALRFIQAVQLSASTNEIGADVAQVDDVLRSHLGLGAGKGLVVTSVTDDGPAAKAGIQKNDVLVSAGGEEISGLGEFRKQLHASPPAPQAIDLIRAGRKLSLLLTPRAPALRAEAVVDIDSNASEPKYWLGVGLAPADDTLRSHIGDGLVVVSVEADSPAAEAGVMINDMLLELDGRPLAAVEEVSQRLQSIADKPVTLKLLRRGKPATLSITPVLHIEAATTALRLFQRDLPLWTDAEQTNAFLVATQIPMGIDSTWQISLTAPPDVAKQLSDIEAQVKQLEASLAALRSAIAPAEAAVPGGEEKK